MIITSIDKNSTKVYPKAHRKQQRNENHQLCVREKYQM